MNTRICVHITVANCSWILQESCPAMSCELDTRVYQAGRRRAPALQVCPASTARHARVPTFLFLSLMDIVTKSLPSMVSLTACLCLPRPVASRPPPPVHLWGPSQRTTGSPTSPLSSLSTQSYTLRGMHNRELITSRPLAWTDDLETLAPTLRTPLPVLVQSTGKTVPRPLPASITMFHV